MKIRNGFVSNSSSSSFLLYGIAIDDGEIIEITKKMFPAQLKEYCDEWDEKEADEYAACEVLDEELGKIGLEFENMMGEAYWIGKSWDKVKDDETGKQFKESVEKQLKESGIKDKCSTHKEAWRDG